MWHSGSESSGLIEGKTGITLDLMQILPLITSNLFSVSKCWSAGKLRKNTYFQQKLQGTSCQYSISHSPMVHVALFTCAFTYCPIKCNNR